MMGAPKADGGLHTTPVRNPRNRSLIVPREHGAWGILLIPLFTGACIGLISGGSSRGLAPLLLVTLSLFWLRTPVESWVGTAPIRAHTLDEFRAVRTAVLLLATASGAGLIWLFWGGPDGALIWMGCAAGTAFLAQSAVKWIWPKERTAAQMIGAVGLTSTAAAAYAVVSLRLGAMAWTLWAANLLFALNQIQFVQLRIHAARAESRRQKLANGREFLAGQLLLIALVLAAGVAEVLPWSSTLAFLPLLVRGFAWFVAQPKPLAIHALGKSELLYACAFGVLLVAGMRLA
jgi:hypothetical protein